MTEGKMMNQQEALQALLAILAVFMKMSDDAQALGGATSIAGVASLHKMQTVIQKNGRRLVEIAKNAEAAKV